MAVKMASKVHKLERPQWVAEPQKRRIAMNVGAIEVLPIDAVV